MINEFWFESFNVSCFKNGYKVLKDLNLNLNYSQNVILLGPNGSGKSSILELINRNIYPIASDKVIFKIFNKELINLWELRDRISTVNNDIKSRISPKLLVIDLLISGLYGKYCLISKKTKRDITIAKNLLTKMNLNKISQRYFSHLSDGEKQIVLIARGLINNPEILILDEPTANLDYNSKFYVLDQIDKLSKIKTKILCVTHDLTTITNIYDRIIMLKEGVIIADGFQKDVINKTNIDKLFDINIEINRGGEQWNIHRSIK